MKNIFCAVLGILLVASTVHGQIPLSGYFLAKEECPAYQSFRKKTNPGAVRTRINTSYEVIGQNTQKGSHYLIKMDAQPNSRWVAVSCGKYTPGMDSAEQKAQQVKQTQQPNSASHYILAISWQPGFCETSPHRKECITQTDTRFDATHFSLHGLWPQPRSNIYCDVSPEIIAKDKKRKWRKLAPLDLKPETRLELNTVMPGTQSFLHRHEWIKHGTCYNDETPDSYYKDSLMLMRRINSDESALRNLFEEHIGEELTSSQIQTAFEETFGDTTGDKIKIFCKRDGDRLLITEITIGLRGNLGETPMEEALLTAPDANNIGCSKGIVDPVGLQ